MRQFFKRIVKCRIHRMGADAIELLADVIVAWNEAFFGNVSH